MHIHRYEKYWLGFGFCALVAFIIFMFITAFVNGHHPSGGSEVIDPTHVEKTPPFDNPGLHQTGENEYEADIVAMAFGYKPNKLEIPLGAKVKFVITSQDVVHSFTIPQTTVNMELVPGHIGTKEYTFKKPGHYLVLCNEYCGAGHQMMKMEIEVLDHASKK
ncbi:cytochrome c oxidase subunit II [Brevibacillus fulvus]|uniref:Cytochrome aa3 subunit 2 n=1 Tax=Brevibacillus fulvus TaxID=1125967 RepID=A0A939BW31_9BACL|nr:cytochrome c oxidase subunit II [Brevibacillus fulvus]MBM7591376.1 cytochrome c oxidase subunit 2 [Brevibacillus fulvus]